MILDTLIVKSPRISKSIQKIERYRQTITERVIKDTIHRMRVFSMSSRVKVGKLKITEYAIVDDDRLYCFGGYSDSD
jgi:hypothetical protein